MPETETAPAHHPAATMAAENGGGAAAAPQNVRYQISEDAMKSLRISRHINKSNAALVIPVRRPSRNHSGGSRRSRDQSPNSAQKQAGVANGGESPSGGTLLLDNTRYSNRSSTSSSLWSSLRGGGRRIYGSAVSVASSITLTEFSEDFGVSDRSLDLRQFAIDEDENYENDNDNNNNNHINMDSSPMIPKRQTSERGKDSSYASLSISGRTFGTDGTDTSSTNNNNNNNNNNINGPRRKPCNRGCDDDDNRGADRIPAPPPRVEYQLSSSDLSPKQPGRKISLAANSTTSAAIAASVTGTTTASVVTGPSDLSTIPANNLNHHNNNPQKPKPSFVQSSTVDSCPQYPCRKKSSIVSMDEEQQQFLMDLSEMGKMFQENLTLSSLSYQNKIYHNAFDGARAIDHMIDTGLVIDRQEGMELGVALEKELGLFHHVVIAAQEQDQEDDPSSQPQQQQQPQQSLLSYFCDDSNEIYQFAPPPRIPQQQRLFSSVRSKTDTSISSIKEEATLEETTTTAKSLSIPQTTTTTA